MAKIESHRDLKVWQKGMDLVVAVYAWAKQLPVEERYGLIQQVTRACVAIPANFAEGHSRGTRKDYAHFVSIARGSLMETETYVMIAERLGFVRSEPTRDLLERMTELGRMLTSLRQRLTEPRT
jgi:four helix bundle protein